jgi:hypothetical protein
VAAPDLSGAALLFAGIDQFVRTGAVSHHHDWTSSQLFLFIRLSDDIRALVFVKVSIIDKDTGLSP